jgi:Meckel syndrome type 1 protein
MEKSNKRGKIPQTDWPLIMVRYESGETLASIARTYDCSPPAISYIVSRNREQPASEVSTLPVAEPQLLKAQTNGTAAMNEPAVAPPGSPTDAPLPASSEAPAPAAEIRREATPDARPNGAPNGAPKWRRAAREAASVVGWQWPCRDQRQRPCGD